MNIHTNVLWNVLANRCHAGGVYDRASGSSPVDVENRCLDHQRVIGGVGLWSGLKCGAVVKRFWLFYTRYAWSPPVRVNRADPHARKTIRLQHP